MLRKEIQEHERNIESMCDVLTFQQITKFGLIGDYLNPAKNEKMCYTDLLRVKSLTTNIIDLGFLQHCFSGWDLIPLVHNNITFHGTHWAFHLFCKVIMMNDLFEIHFWSSNLDRLWIYFTSMTNIFY